MVGVCGGQDHPRCLLCGEPLRSKGCCQAASVDTLPKGQDAKQGLAGTESGAVPNGETPNPCSTPETGLVEALQADLDEYRKAIPLPETNPVCGFGCGGVYLIGNEKSIAALKQWHHDATARLPAITQELIEARAALSNVLPDEV